MKIRRILITGASRGIGKAIATKVAAPSVTLFLHGRDEQALADTAGLVKESGGEAVVLAYDLADQLQVASLARGVGSEPLDALIHNAGFAIVKPFGEVTADEWQRSFAVNVTAPFLLTQLLVTQMEPGASIVHILSVAAKTGFPNWSAYCTAKFALEGLSRSLREELRPKGIRVISVYPAATNTDIWDVLDGDWPREKMLSASVVADAVAFALSQPSSAVVEEIQLSTVSGRL